MSSGVRIQGIEEVNAKLMRLNRSGNFKHPRALFKKIAIILDQWSIKNFQSEGKLAMSGGWANLKAATIDRRRKGRGRGGGRRVRILQDTGRGRASVKVLSSDKMAKIYTNLNYMVAHHAGAGRLPERRVIPQYKQVKRRVKAAMNAHLGKAVRSSFGT